MSESPPAVNDTSRRRLRPLNRLKDYRQAVRQFTPNWFALTMGTGIVYLLLMTMPVHFPFQSFIAEILWIGDIAAFSIFAALFLARAVFFAETIRPLLDHPVQSMFLGAIPMGLIPSINGMVIFGVQLFGDRALALASILWWTDAFLAVFIAGMVPYRMFTSQVHSRDQMTAVWLLPVVGPEVTASSAGFMAPHIPVASAQLVIVTGYVLWAMSISLAFIILTHVFSRLAFHKLPHRDMAASSWLTLGPIGTGSLGLITLGQAAADAFQTTEMAPVATLARNFGIFGGLLLWGIGIWWVIIAVLLTVRYLREGMTFNMGWWGFTFPLGVFTAATFALYKVTLFTLFAVLGTVLFAALAVFWMIVVTKTCHGMWHGYLFQAPCLVNFDDLKPADKQEDQC